MNENNEKFKKEEKEKKEIEDKRKLVNKEIFQKNDKIENESKEKNLNEKYEIKNEKYENKNEKNEICINENNNNKENGANKKYENGKNEICLNGNNNDENKSNEKYENGKNGIYLNENNNNDENGGKEKYEKSNQKYNDIELKGELNNKIIEILNDIKIDDKEKFEIKIKEYKIEIVKNYNTIINSFIKDYFEEKKYLYYKKIDEFISNYINEIYNKERNITYNFSYKYNDIFKFLDTNIDSKEELKKYMIENIFKKLELILLKKSFYFLINDLIRIFSEYFIGLYTKEISSPEIKNKILEIISFNNVKLREEINNYNNLIKSNKQKEEDNLNIDEEELEIEDDINDLLKNIEMNDDN